MFLFLFFVFEGEIGRRGKVKGVLIVGGGRRVAALLQHVGGS